MNCEQLKNSYNNYIIIDIRSKEDYNEGHIPNSINIEHIELMKNANLYLDKNIEYLVICDEGVTSLAVVRILRDYKLTNVIGGFSKWEGPVSK